jgi:hypothetical protein
MKRVSSKKEHLCFSICTLERTLDLQCSTQDERDIWVEGLLIQWADLRTRKMQWTGRHIKSIQQNPEVDTPPPVEEHELPWEEAEKWGPAGGFFGAEER